MKWEAALKCDNLHIVCPGGCEVCDQVMFCGCYIAEPFSYGVASPE